MLRVNLIGWDNGVGLSRDLRLIEHVLREAGLQVHLQPARGRGKLRKWLGPWLQRARFGARRLLRRQRYHLNIMLEHVKPEYLQAAERGNAKAMHNLAVLDADGGGKGADYKSASQWFRKAADRGVADSQFNLGILYARGIGVEQTLGLVLASDAFLPHENLKFIQRGQFDAHEKARLANAVAAAIVWTRNQAVQIIIDGKPAVEAKGLAEPQETVDRAQGIEAPQQAAEIEGCAQRGGHLDALHDGDVGRNESTTSALGTDASDPGVVDMDDLDRRDPHEGTAREQVQAVQPRGGAVTHDRCLGDDQRQGSGTQVHRVRRLGDDVHALQAAAYEPGPLHGAQLLA